MMTHALSTAPATRVMSIPRLRTLFEGRVITPHDAGYDEARTVFYGGIDRPPALIVRARGATDVSRVVSLAREGGVGLARPRRGRSPPRPRCSRRGHRPPPPRPEGQ